MNRFFITIVLTCFVLFNGGCRNRGTSKPNDPGNMTKDSSSLYGFNRQFLSRHVEIIELKRDSSAIILVPAWQGRVMTSTSSGGSGYSYGWINRSLISEGSIQPHINAFGGEERFWLGPEGGQFSIFFTGGKEFTFENWQTPPFIDTMPWEVESLAESSVEFRASTGLINYSGSVFRIKAGRKVSLLSGRDLKENTGIDTEGLEFVAYRSDNSIMNTGSNEWKKETGLLSVWMLGMFNPSPSVTVVIPVRADEKSIPAPKVNDNYFGSISPDRLRVIGNHVFFRADGKSRGKIGIHPLRAAGVMGSYDSQNNILTLLFCKLPEGVTGYVNSAWQIQDDPYSGDAYNSYNDGPLEDGSQMGPFYELETSSPAAALLPGERMVHSQVTVHLTGSRGLLNNAAVKILGIGLSEIESVFK